MVLHASSYDGFMCQQYLQSQFSSTSCTSRMLTFIASTCSAVKLRLLPSGCFLRFEINQWKYINEPCKKPFMSRYWWNPDAVEVIKLIKSLNSSERRDIKPQLVKVWGAYFHQLLPSLPLLCRILPSNDWDSQELRFVVFVILPFCL